MRLPFGDSERRKGEAKKAVDLGIAQVKRWWINKYNLPPNHELFQNQSMAELTQEMYEDLYCKRSELESLLDSNDPDIDRNNILEQLNGVNKALGEQEEVEDPLAAQWEKDLEEGRIPDLNA